MAWGPGVTLSVEEVEVAPPGPLEVRVKVLFTSICHTDLSAWKGEVHYSFIFLDRDRDLISLLDHSTNLPMSLIYISIYYICCHVTTTVCCLSVMDWTSQNEMHRKYPRILGHEAAGLVMLILFSTHGPPLRPLMACVHVISRQLAECFTGVLSPAMDFRVNTSLEYLK